MSRARWLPALLALAAALGALPGAALPPGPPAVTVSARQVGGTLDAVISAEATDPDGRIRSLEICVDDGSACVTETYPGPAGPDEAIADCLAGGSRAIEITHTFARADTYRIVARATATGCPGLAGTQSGEAHGGIAIESPAQPPPREPVPCKGGGGGGATDVGVEPDLVLVGATVASGVHVAHLSGGARGIRAAELRVNDPGGVCERILDAFIVDDGADHARGKQFIDNMIAQGHFALVAMPSPDGLRGAIASGSIDAEGIPVVGTTGGTSFEFESPWVWPAGPSNADFASIAARHAYDRGARRFGVVWVRDVRFGMEVRAGLADTLGALPGAILVADAALDSAQASYASQAQEFSAACHEGCDAVVYAGDPVTVLSWLASGPRTGEIANLLSPHLMNEGFADACGRACDGFLAWTPFHPPVGEAPPAALRYAADLRAIDPNADPVNPFTEGAYFGTLLAALGMGETGARLTRDGLGRTLDRVAFDLGVTAAPLSYKHGRAANRAMRAYEMVAPGGRFIGWREATGWIAAP